MLILSLHLLFGAAAQQCQLDAPAQPVFNEQLFCKGFYQLFDQQIAPHLEKDFLAQIMDGFQSQERLTELFSQLPFESDNIGTGDCVFNACSVVLAANELFQRGAAVSPSPSFPPENLKTLTQMAVLTFLRHSSVFFEHYFCSALDAFSKITKMQPANSVQELYATWSMNHESSVFSQYKYNLLISMAQSVSRQTGIPIAIRYLSDVDESVKKDETKNPLRNRRIFVSYANCKPKDDALYVLQASLINTVKHITGRLIFMERVFGQIDNGGEYGKVHVLRKLRAVSLTDKSCSEDAYDVHDSIYTRIQGPLSPIKVEHTISTDVSSQQDVLLPTLVLQVPTTELDAKTALFLGIEQKAQVPIKVYVRKSDRFIAWEQSDAHAMTANLPVVASGKNLWFTGERGLKPITPFQITPEMLLPFTQSKSLT